MSNKSLKGFVRLDASNRIVAGSLILRQNKPKIGRWKEVIADYCCGPTTTTTTTTTII